MTLFLVEQLVENLLFAEGVMDASATQISRVVVNALKAYYLNPRKRRLGLIRHFQTEIPIPGKEDELFITVTFTPTEIKQFFVAGGQAIEDREITLSIEVPQDPESYNKPPFSSNFYVELKNIVQHELEHVRQFQRSKNIKQSQFQTSYKTLVPTQQNYTGPENATKDYGDAIAYFLNPIEVEAYVVGLYRIAKMKKVPFQKILSNYVHLQLKPQFMRHMSRDQAIDLAYSILHTYMDYAKSRYPNLQLL